jgi:hypothetical protein
MIQIAPQTEIGLALEAVDFRRGIDGLTPGMSGVAEERSLLGGSVCFS